MEVATNEKKTRIFLKRDMFQIAAKLEENFVFEHAFNYFFGTKFFPCIVRFFLITFP